MSAVTVTPTQLLPPHFWTLDASCLHGASHAEVWLGTDAPDRGLLNAEATQNHRRLYPLCDCDAPPPIPKVAHMASDRPMPEEGISVEWDVIENYPPFIPGQQAAVDGLGRLEIAGVNESALGRLTVLNTGAVGNQPPGTLAYAGTLITAIEAA